MEQRKRGRPAGSSRWNVPDAATLRDVAGIVVQQHVKPTTAMRQLGITDYATTKRLQRKWKSQEAVLISASMAEPQGREFVEPIVRLRTGLVAFAKSPEVQEAVKNLYALVTHPVWGDLRDQFGMAMKSPLMQQLISLTNSPAWKGSTAFTRSHASQ